MSNDEADTRQENKKPCDHPGEDGPTSGRGGPRGQQAEELKIPRKMKGDHGQ